MDAAPGADRIKVMIVDDEEDIRKLLAMCFDVNGFEVVAMVGDGDKAVPAALETQPDVIILDFMMPRVNGAETANFIRAVSPGSRIVAFSGVVMEKPDWADDYTPKGGVAEIVELARRVMEKEPIQAPEEVVASPQVQQVKGLAWT